MKKCTKCKKEKPLSEFNKDKSYKCGYNARCRDCSLEDYQIWLSKGTNIEKVRSNKREWKAKNPEKVKISRKKEYLTNIERIRSNTMLKRYGISLNDYYKLLEKQNFGCKICGRIDTGAATKKYFSVDHNHKTGKVRGLLCIPCNSILGLAKDNILILEKAIKYLKETSNVEKE